MDKSKTLGTKLDSGTIPNGLEGFWIPSFKDSFLSRRAKPYYHDSQLCDRRTTPPTTAPAVWLTTCRNAPPSAPTPPSILRSKSGES
jgi:hypothetical protein